MPTFTYKASNQSGKIVQDDIVAEDNAHAIHDLQKLNYIVFSIKEKKDSFLKKISNIQPSVSFFQKVIFFKHLSSMIEAGLTVTETIETLAQQTSNKGLQKILQETVGNLRSGLSLHYCLSRYPKIFPKIGLSMIQIGEASGNLNETLLYLTEQMEKTYDTRKKIVGAFIYPAIVLGMTTVLVLFMMMYTLPKITEILVSFNSELPTSTKVIIAVSNVLRNHFVMIFASVVSTVIGLKILAKRPSVKPLIHKLLLGMPIFGDLFKKSSISLFARTFSSLIQSGVPIVKALNITSETMSNYHYYKAIKDAANKTEQGGTLAETIESYKALFPPVVAKMIAVGEKIGNLDQTTEHLAKLYEKEVEQATKNLSTLLEPLLLMIMGLTVGGISVAIISPIYQISSSALG